MKGEMRFSGRRGEQTTGEVMGKCVEKGEASEEKGACF